MRGGFPRGKFRHIRICFSRPLFGSPRCFFNNYSVHCCAHIMLGRSRTRDNAEFGAISAMFRLKSVSAATQNVRVLVNSSADCVCESGICASFPIMAADLLPGPSSPLLFSGKRELWRQRQPREGLTQRRPHTTAAGRSSAASTPEYCICGARYSEVIDFSPVRANFQKHRRRFVP